MLKIRQELESYIYRRGNWHTPTENNRQGQVNIHLNLELAIGVDTSLPGNPTVRELRIYDVFNAADIGNRDKRSRIYLQERYLNPNYSIDRYVNNGTAKMAVILALSTAPVETVKAEFPDVIANPRSTGEYVEDDQYAKNYVPFPDKYNALGGTSAIIICGDTTFDNAIPEYYPIWRDKSDVGRVINYVTDSVIIPGSGGGRREINVGNNQKIVYYYFNIDTDANVGSLYFMTNSLRFMTEGITDFPDHQSYWTNWFPHKESFYNWDIDFKLNKSSVQITDDSCQSTVNGIKVDNKDTIGIEITGDATIDYIDFKITPNRGNLSVTYSSTDSKKGIINITGNTNPVNYPNTETVTILDVIPDETNSFNVSFYERANVNLFGSDSLSINIKDTNLSSGFNITDYSPQTINTTSDRNVALDEIYTSPRTFSPTNNNTFLNIRSYLQLESDASNWFKISGERSRHHLDWTFFNHYVNDYTYNGNLVENKGYHKTLNTYVTWYITPQEINQFSFDWLDSNNQVTTPPKAILPDFNLPVPGNLKYLNNTVQGGYCRAFKINYLNQNGSLLKSSIFYATENSDKTNEYLGKVISKTSLVDLPYNVPITIQFVMCFYFNGNRNTLYEGAKITLEQKLYRINQDDILPTLVFPLVSLTAPYSPMMLTEVERFGYNIPTLTLGLASELDISFGVRVNNQQFTITVNPDYFSCNKLTTHIVADIGRIVKDNNINLTNCSVIPFLTLFTSDNQNVKQVYRETDPNNLSNRIINTELSTMWNRPIISQGEYATYFDYDRFMQFINKYRYLYNNQIYNVPTNKQGEIIHTDFWTSVADNLDQYAQSMQNWATDTTNYVVLWALPEFMHKKGEIITNNNLYQNYYDLLIQHDGHLSFATHEYLNTSNYTHNALHSYTHEQITNKEGI